MQSGGRRGRVGVGSWLESVLADRQPTNTTDLGGFRAGGFVARERA